MDAVAEIKRRIDIVEYIGRTTALKRSGRNFSGLCPFHSEKTPSFYVTPDRGTWRCYGACSEGGDLFTFVQKRDNLDFRGALQLLAREAGVELSPGAAKRRSRAEHLASIVSAAVDFYEQQLASPAGDAARAYLERRGLTPPTIAAFRLGWAPDDWRPLRDHLAARGFSDEDAIAAGMLVEAESGGQPYDRFRGRVIIPIADDRGVFVALAGRGLADEQPKYLNSPQTEIFDKGRTLFGLDMAGPAAREQDTVVVVEGYMDVIGPWQAGFKNVVATMGTSLTFDHAAILRRHARRVVLAMDPDAAGLAAAERAGQLIMDPGSVAGAARSVRSAEAVANRAEIDLRVAPLPTGKDPAEIVRDDPEAWGRAIAGATPYVAFLIDRLLGDAAPDSPIEARRLVDQVLPVVAEVRDPVERGHYVQRIARHLGIHESAVVERLRQRRIPGRPQRETPDRERPRRPSLEELLLATMLRYPLLRDDLRHLPADLFTEAINREAFLRWRHGDPAADEGIEDDPVAAHMRDLLARRQPELPLSDAKQRVSDFIRSILRERLIQRQAALTEELAAAEKTHGARKVEEVGHAAWQGAPLEDETAALAQTVIEELELGLSLHRHEGPTIA